MHANDEVLGYLSLRFLGNTLKAGWIEKALVSKGISGNLVDKENQNRYVIPLSTTIKSIIDRGINYPGDSGILILGIPGLTCEKFVVVFRNESDDDEMYRILSAFWIKNYNPNEITRLFLKHEMGSALLTAFDEPVVDYIEYLRDQASTGHCVESFSLSIPSNWRKSRTWIPDLIKEDSSDSVLLNHDAAKNTTALALLFSNWIKDMTDTLQLDKLVGACFFIRGNIAEAFFWDGARDILTSSTFSSPDIEKHAMNILLPLWDDSSKPISSSPPPEDIPTASERESPTESVPVRPPPLPPEFKEIESRARGLVNRIDIDDTFRRIERIESILGELEHSQEQEEDKPTSSHPNLMESRIKDALDSLEDLTKRLSELEERIVTVCRELE
jgi:hypothetical protein